ncbi:MAG: peptidase S8, partial [candidate division Zixibacteria bacterium]|nr:peptidase S8 [Candidatus Tariuqbacter arcticus]
DGFKPAGIYEVTFDGAGLSSGVYFAVLQAGNFNQTRKLILIK